MERADSRMDDAHVDATRIVARRGDRRRNLCEGEKREMFHSTIPDRDGRVPGRALRSAPLRPPRAHGGACQAGCGCSLTRETSWVGLTNRNAISSQISVTTM